ncbi:MAG TPA: beta-propeller fold lactonase family protein [Planctomycetota bacterium]|nr:beta-propeller fold lactonase family protein [Planctomycetota bacterium]
MKTRKLALFAAAAALCAAALQGCDGSGSDSGGSILVHVRSAVFINGARGHLPPDTTKLRATLTVAGAATQPPPQEIPRPAGADLVDFSFVDVTTGNFTIDVLGLNAAGAITAEGTISGAVSGGSTLNETLDLLGIVTFVYATVDDLNGAAPAGSTVEAFTLDPATGVLTPVNVVALKNGAFSDAPPVFTEDGLFGYVVNPTDGLLHALSVDPATGAIAELAASPSTVNSLPNRPTIVGSYLYQSHEDSTDLLVFHIEADGTLTPIQTVTLPDVGARRVVPNRSKDVVYVALAGDVIVTLAIQLDGTLVQVGTPLDVPPTGTVGTGEMGTPVVHPTGNFVFVTSGGTVAELRALAVAANGSLTLLNTAPLGEAPQSPAIAPSGNFIYVPNQASQSISAFSIGVTGNVTTIADYPVPGDPLDTDPLLPAPNRIAFDALGKFLYVGKGDSASIAGYGIDAADGSLTHLVISPFQTAPFGPAAGPVPSLDPNGNFDVVANQDLMTDSLASFFVHPTTGALSQQGTALSTTLTGPHLAHLRPVRLP